MLSDLFAEQRLYINAFFDQLDLSECERVLEKLLVCEGSLVLTGVGKSGRIAEKIAATLVSTGTYARYLSPMDALHGDIGCLSNRDLLILFSKSGESKELLDLVPYAQKKGVSTIGIVSVSHSRLARQTDLSVVLPIEKELCPYNLVPTTSATAQLIFGDCLAIALMRKRQFTLDDLALNHPAGLLGKKVTVKVSDLMLMGDRLPLCSPSSRLIDTLHELTKKQCGCVLAVGPERTLEGIFTDGDLRRALEKGGENSLNKPIESFMTREPKTTSPGALAADALHRMEEDRSRLITVLPVLEEGKVIGLIRLHDILQMG